MLKNQSLALLMLGSPMGMGMAPELHPDVWSGLEKSQMTNLTVLNNFCFTLLTQSLALLMMGSPMGMGMAPELHPDIWKNLN